MPGKAKEEEPVGVSIQHSVKPTSISGFLKLEPGNLPVAAVENGSKLGDCPSQQERYIASSNKQP